jgi:hypothetical protein
MAEIGENLFVDGDQLDYTIHQGKSYGRIAEPLTVRAIIRRIGKIWRENTTLSDGERAFLTKFAAAGDRGAFIEDCFFGAAIEGGKSLETYTYGMPDVDEVFPAHGQVQAASSTSYSASKL